MLILFLPLLLSTLNLATSFQRRSVSPGLANTNRGVIETSQTVPQAYKFHQTVPNLRNLPQSLSYKNVKIIPQESSLIYSGNSPAYNDGFKHAPLYTSLPLIVRPAESQSSEQLSPHPENLFTMSAAYKVGADGNSKLLKPAGTGLQVPVYRSSYHPSSKASESQIYTPTFQNKKTPLSILQRQKNQELPAYLSSFQSQPLVSNSAGHRLNFVGKPSNPNHVQPSAPFLSPHSNFQGQVVPIPTATNNPQFPQYKGAAVETHPTVGAFSPVAYQHLQTQPQLHFGHTNAQHVQRVDDLRRVAPSQAIRSDVEIINKHMPRLPPKKDDDDDDDDDGDEGYTLHEKQYGGNSDVDNDYKPKPHKYFKASSVEGNFKPSTSFPFKQYDETFGRHSNQHQEEVAEKPLTKYRDHASTNDEKDDVDPPREEYHSDDASTKSYYTKPEDEEEEDDDSGRDYEKQRAENSSDDEQRFKYFDKDFDDEFEASYKSEVPKRKYARAKETPEEEYTSGSSRKSKSNFEDEDPSSRRSRPSSNYRKTSQDYEDTDGHSSDMLLTGVIPETIRDEIFGYKVPQKKF